MVDLVAALNILQYSLDALKAGQSVAGYKVSDPAHEENRSHELEGAAVGAVNETENLQ